MMNNVSDTPGSVYINNMAPELDSINKTHLPMRLVGKKGIKKSRPVSLLNSIETSQSVIRATVR